MKILLALSFLFFIGCGSPEKEHALKAQQDSIHRYDSLMKPRRQVYGVAVDVLKTLLKAPSTAKIPAITLNNDTVKVYNDSKYAFIMFPYDAQNPMGTFMRGYYKAILMSWEWDSAGWKAIPIPDECITLEGVDDPRYDYENFDKAASLYIKKFEETTKK